MNKRRINMSHTNKIIVFGNQKGGTGKSTLAMHLVVKLLKSGFTVATIDADAEQGTLSRYIENRKKTQKENSSVLLPFHTPIYSSQTDSVSEMLTLDLAAFSELMQKLENYDFIVVDTPGHNSHLSKIAHSFADIIITPMNESFIDLDLIIRATPGSNNGIKTSSYAEYVWNQKKERAKRDHGMIDWVILLNRMSGVQSRNRQELDKILAALSKRLGFRVANGFKERVIFRELFISGLTLLDDYYSKMRLNLSHIAAKQELNDLLRALNI